MRHLSAILVILMGLVLSAPLSYGASDDTKKEQKSEQANDSKPILLLHVGELLAVPGQTPLTQQTIVVEGDKIKAVHAGYQTPEDLDFPDARLIDLKDKFVMPGLMDLHVHPTMTKDHDSKADDMALVGVVNARKTLMAGYTTVRDIGAWGNTIFKLRKKVQAGEIDGPRIFAAGQIIGVGSKDGGLECNGPESCRRTTRDLIKAGADWIKIYSSCSGSQLCSNENGAPVFFADEIEAVTQVAAKYGVKVAAHSHPRNSALFVLKYGVSSIEHGSFMDDKALRAMKKQGTYFVPTVSVHDMLEKLKADGKVEGKMRVHNDAFLAQHPDTILRAYKMGVQIATGSDAGVVPHGKNYREIERFVALGIPAAQALKMATVNGADLLGRSEDLGTLEQGKYADIIALDGNPLTQIENIEKVVFVMKSGKVFRRE